jgi:hypothetical protein
MASAEAPIVVESHPAYPLPMKKLLYLFLDQSQSWFHRRLNGALGHMRAKSSRRWQREDV